jgi:hypothetical protein
MVPERQAQEDQRLVHIRVEGLKAWVAADLVEMVIQRLQQQGCKVERIKEESA